MLHRCCTNAWRNVTAYRAAMRRWRQAGKPMRPGHEIVRLFSVCVLCKHFVPRRGRPWRGRCGECGCYLGRHKHRFLRANKIALATEHCPLGKW